MESKTAIIGEIWQMDSGCAGDWVYIETHTARGNELLEDKVPHGKGVWDQVHGGNGLSRPSIKNENHGDDEGALTVHMESMCPNNGSSNFIS